MFETRLKNLRKSLAVNKISALIVSSTANILYLTGYDNFSKDEREAYLFVNRTSAMLFTDGRYIEAVKHIVPNNIKVFLHTEMFKKIKLANFKRVGIEDNFTVSELKRFRKEMGMNFVVTDLIIENLRAVKDDEEIKNIKLACQLTDKTYSHVLKNIRMNITEKELAWRIEKFIKEEGEELAFETIVAFGTNSAIPHHKTSNKKLSMKDEFVLLDFGAKVNGYCSDMTRTILTKNANSKAREIYKIVLKSQVAAADYINNRLDDRSSTPVTNIQSSEVAKVANKVMVESGFPEIPHGLGHGIGIEIHELPHLSPKSKDKLVKGNVFTIEPGIYIPGFGGVRIEDDFLLDTKLEQLTRSLKDLVDPD